MIVPKPLFKKDRKKWKGKAITLAKKQVREEFGHCQICKKSGGKLEGAHIIPVDFEATAADKENILCLCPQCHKFNKCSAHMNPVWFSNWLEDNFPGRKDRLWEKAKPCTNYSAYDWKEIYDNLKGGK